MSPQSLDDAGAPRTLDRLRDGVRAWRERRATRRCCREMLALYEEVAPRHPGLAGRELYRRVLALHMDPTGPAIDDVLRGAEDSFAQWPAARELRFRDVVHFVAALRLMGADRAVSADIKAVVDAAIPSQL